MERSKAYLEGLTAFNSGLSSMHNPYDIDSIESNDWYDGYNDAMCINMGC